jgi:hypothetical protein
MSEELVMRLRSEADIYGSYDVITQRMLTEAADAIEAQAAEIKRLRRVAIDVAASLAAAISLLERGGETAKKAAPSDSMFDQMLRDYTASLDRARAALSEPMP